MSDQEIALEACRFAYRTFAQFNRYPMDPFYEGTITDAKHPRRPAIMESMRQYLPEDTPKSESNAWEELDPLLYESKVPDPKASLIYRAEGWKVVRFNPRDLDREIGKQILVDVNGEINDEQEVGGQGNAHCIYFTGRTGMTNNHPNRGILSPLGAVHFNPDTGLCIIAFRGSRSGSGGRSASNAFLYSTGNPDWVTDMNCFKESQTWTESIDSNIFKYIKTSKEEPLKIAGGFAMAYSSCVASLTKALQLLPLEKVSKMIVTGHSLGGALALHCYLDLLFGQTNDFGSLVGKGNIYCYPISAPPLFLNKDTADAVIARVEKETGKQVDKVIEHIAIRKDLVHAGPNAYSGEARKVLATVLLIGETISPIIAGFSNLFQLEKRNKGDILKPLGYHIGKETILEGAGFPTAHEPAEVYEKYLNKDPVDNGFWQVLDLDIPKQLAKLQQQELDGWQYSTHKELLNAYYDAVDKTDKNERGIKELHEAVIQEGQTLAGALEELTKLEGKKMGRGAKQYLGILRCMLLGQATNVLS